MKTLFFISIAGLGLTACDVKVDNSDPPAKSSTTIVTPGEKKVENNTTIVNPPKEEKKVENKTTIINPPPATKVETKTEETTITKP